MIIFLNPEKTHIRASLFINDSIRDTAYGPTVDSAIGRLVIANPEIFGIDLDFADNGDPNMTPLDGQRITIPECHYSKMMAALKWSDK